MLQRDLIKQCERQGEPPSRAAQHESDQRPPITGRAGKPFGYPPYARANPYRQTTAGPAVPASDNDHLADSMLPGSSIAAGKPCVDIVNPQAGSIASIPELQREPHPGDTHWQA
jgi:hypothetical protein